jgi:hypothetical protein
MITTHGLTGTLATSVIAKGCDISLTMRFSADAKSCRPFWRCQAAWKKSRPLILLSAMYTQQIAMRGIAVPVLRSAWWTSCEQALAACGTGDAYYAYHNKHWGLEHVQ